MIRAGATLAALPMARRALSSAAEVALRYGNPHPVPQSFLPALSFLPEVEITTLDSGLRVASAKSPHAKTSTVGVWIDAGSRFETAADNGAAHFLEHMAFKGTNKRTASSLEQEVENMGGHLNAYTSREQTTYYAKVLSKDSGAALEMISDILQHPTLDQGAIEREKGVILREMEEVESVPEEVLFDHLHATAFQHCSLGRTILGPAANVGGMTKQQLESYIGTHYTAPRMVISAVGDVDHKDVVALSKKLFDKLPLGDPEGSTSKIFVDAEPARFTGSEVRIRDPDMPKLHFAVAVEGLPWTDPDAPALMVMQAMLGQWDSTGKAGGGVGGSTIHSGAKLAGKIATNGLCDSVSAFNTHYADSGLFGMYAVADPDKADDLAWAMMHEFAALSHEVEPFDVERAKNALKASCLLSLDGTSGLAEDIGRSLITYGRYMSKAELFTRIDAVDAETVKAVAGRVIYDQDVAIAAMGDTTLLPDYNWFRRRNYWLRY